MNTWCGHSGKIGLVLASLVVSATTFAAAPRWDGGTKAGSDAPTTPTGRAAPGASVPLKLYRHPKLGYVSVATEASEQELLKAGYQFVRIEGYVLPSATSGAPVASGSSGATRTVTGSERAYLRIQGRRQGPIRALGPEKSGEKGHEDDIVIQGIVTDEAARQLKVIKRPDSTSPKLSQARQDQEPLTLTEIAFARLGSDGKYGDYETLRLKDAQIIGIGQRFEGGGRVEEVAFSYECLERVVRQGSNVITSGCDRK